MRIYISTIIAFPDADQMSRNKKSCEPPLDYSSLTDRHYDIDYLSALSFNGVSIQPNSCFALFMTISKPDHVFADIPENLKVNNSRVYQ